MRKIIKSIIPPILIETYRKLRYKNYRADKKQFIWEGIYDNYRDVPLPKETYQGFGGDIWADQIEGSMQKLMQEVKQNDKIPFDLTEERMLLPLLVASNYGKAEKCKILDIGGGMGNDYIYLCKSLGKNSWIDYTVVEFENICQRGTHLFKGDSAIRFISILPEESEQVDVVYINSALQYIDDYKALLEKACKYKPEHFLFARLSAGYLPTYATLQKNMDGMKMAYWFINVDEIIEIMNENGYTLTYKSVINKDYDQDNFPEKYRLGRAINLLFEREMQI